RGHLRPRVLRRRQVDGQARRRIPRVDPPGLVVPRFTDAPARRAEVDERGGRLPSAPPMRTDGQVPDPRPRALNHIHLTAEDPEGEITFLVDTLGFRRDPSLPSFIWLGNM